MRGIEGVTGREPIGACLVVGKKGPKGNPIDRDRFYITLTTMNNEGIRPLHPLFKAFNERAQQGIRGNLVHAEESGCFKWHLKAQVLDRTGHPDQRPCCIGDGKRAERWDGNAFVNIPCPNHLCQYRQGTKADCKPWFQFLFRPRWPDGNPLPQPLMKLTSMSWNSLSAFVGFFEYIVRQAAMLGVTNHSLYGMPFMLSLSEKKQASKGRRFPVLSIAPDGDLQEWLARQHESMKTLAGAQPIAALTDHASPQEEHEDFIAITADMPRKS